MREQDIRPRELFDEYLRLSARDAEICFRGVPSFPVSCPGCGSHDRRFAFGKLGFEYVECADCESLYLSPRPDEAAFEHFYADSESARYWGGVFFPAVAEARRESIFRPRAEKIGKLCAEQNFFPEVIVDVGAGYGLFLEEWRKTHATNRLVAIEPNSHLAGVCRDKGFEVNETMAENAIGYEATADLVTCFEVIEHSTDTHRFISSLWAIAKPGGYVLVTGLGVDGFDIQVLWGNSKSVFPPHHINFLSRNGMHRLFERVGFEDITVLTPGVLDVDIVLNAIQANPGIELSRFERKVLFSGADIRAKFQSFLADNGFSSHCWILARRPA